MLRDREAEESFVSLVKHTPVEDRGKFISIGLHLLKSGEINMDKEWLQQFFSYSHLPQTLQEVSKPFGELAEKIMLLPRNPERTTALRKLLESKDCAVRALLGGRIEV